VARLRQIATRSEESWESFRRPDNDKVADVMDIGLRH
jgi:hypothetical protein